MTAYNPHEFEKKIYQNWLDGAYFTAHSPSLAPPFSMVIPPPNVTGVLHMGHALVNTLQDILARFKRMKGYEVLWLPGTDHAGISTQTVVEKHLIKTKNKTRKDFSREEFVEEIWLWKEKSEETILGQLKRLGCSCDWSRSRFTLDEGCSLAVRHLFKKMYDDHLIYRGDYLVNWDPISQTALSDDEVEYEEQKGTLWHVRFPIENSQEHLVIATTRPETLLGDVAVAVSPKDARYSHLKGAWLIHPLTHRRIPLIQDAFVDISFGTGAVKITPAHDFNDYEVAERHHLPLINIMTPDGKINQEGKSFQGLSMLEAREAIVKELTEKKLIIKKEPHVHRVGLSYRSKAVIEPFLSKQWFIRMQPFKEMLSSLVQTKQVALFPPHFESVYFQWIENVRDWCISRQLWWGHRIPVWYHKNGEILCSVDTPDCVKEHPDEWHQDTDVLDTWFSSALWPFSTLGWPNHTEDLSFFYPTSVLITGHDILFFWVIRMLLMGKYALGTVPFHQVFLHGLIYGKSYWRQDSEGTVHYLSKEERELYERGQAIPIDVHTKWEKMSKSKGNIIDPLEMIEQYGCDATRLTLTAGVTFARQIDLDIRRFEEFKHFINKIWNGARFVFSHLPEASVFSKGLIFSSLRLEDRWILSSLTHTLTKVEDDLARFHFDKAVSEIYDFFWNRFCADYLEIAKPYLFGKEGSLKDKETKQNCLTLILSNFLRLLHPFAPFITEELFSELSKPFKEIPEDLEADIFTQETIKAFHSKSCMISAFPTLCFIDQEADKHFIEMKELVISLRSLRAEMKIPLGDFISLQIFAPEYDPFFLLLKTHSSLIYALVKIDQITFLTAPLEGHTAQILKGAVQFYVPLSQQHKEKEKERLVKELTKKNQLLAHLDLKLSNEEFLIKAPALIREKMQKERQDLSQLIFQLQTSLKKFM